MSQAEMYMADGIPHLPIISTGYAWTGVLKDGQPFCTVHYYDADPLTRLANRAAAIERARFIAEAMNLYESVKSLGISAIEESQDVEEQTR